MIGDERVMDSGRWGCVAWAHLVAAFYQWEHELIMADQTQKNPTETDAEVSEQTEHQVEAQQPETQSESQEGEAEGILPPESVKVEEIGTLKKKVTVTVPADKISTKRQEMFGELSQTAQVPGFRIGHAPQRLIEKRFRREVGEDVRNALVGQSLGEAIEQADLKVLGEPELNLQEIELPEKGDLEYSFEAEVAPEFDLPETKGIKVERRVLEVNEERINERVEQYRQMTSRYEVTDKAAAEGDAITADVRISGEGINETQIKEVSLRVAPGQVEGIPLVDLGKALTGKKVGQTASLTVKVPEAHPNESWRGKDAEIELEISQVRQRILPEANDELARSFGFESIADLRERVGKNLQSQVAGETRRSMRDQISEYLLDNIEFDLPEGVVSRYTVTVLRRRYVDLLYRGVPREKIDENLTQLQAAASEEAKRNLKLSFILDKVGDVEKIEVSEGEVNARIAEMAARANRRPERFRQELANDGTLQHVEDSIRDEKALEKLLENAQIIEVAPDEEEPKEEEKKTSKKKKESEKARSGTARKSAKKAAKKSSKKSESKKSKKNTSSKKQ